jgi:hypothetical protein
VLLRIGRQPQTALHVAGFDDPGGRFGAAAADKVEPPPSGAEAGDIRRVRERWRRRQGGNSPAGNSGDRLGQHRVIVLAAAAEDKGGDAGSLGGELQAAGGGEGELTGKLGHDCGEARGAEAFLHGEQNGGGLGSVGVDDLVWGEADGGETGSEQVRLVDDPKDWPFQAGGEAGGEQGRGSGMLGFQAGAGDFMEHAKWQPGVWQVLVDFGQAEGQDGFTGSWGRPLQPGDGIPKLGEGWRGQAGLGHVGTYREPEVRVESTDGARRKDPEIRRHRSDQDGASPAR